MSRRAFSLAETLIAMFFLFSTFVVFTALMDASMREGNRVEKQVMASMLAEKKLAEIQQWSRQGSNFQAGNWGAFATPAGDPDYPGVSVSAVVTDAVVASPATQLESAYGGDQRVMTASVKQVAVTVTWDTSGRLTLVSRIAAPPRSPDPTTPLVVTVVPPAPALPLAKATGSIEFQVEARDASNQPIQGLTYRWYVQPLTGNGTLSVQNRQGTRARLTHTVRMANGSFQPVSGLDALGNPKRVKLKVMAVYHGGELWGESMEVSLAP
ncbi:MAG: hypothetical protein AB1758_30170 [Candidatus Eremiobacterota bacterium]